MSDKETVYNWLKEREPIEQDKLKDEFGNRGLYAIRKLMIKDRVSYTIDYKLQTQR